MIGPDDSEQKNFGPGRVDPRLELALAAVCAVAVGLLTNWPTAVHVFFSVLTLFTSLNSRSPARRRCARCGGEL